MPSEPVCLPADRPNLFVDQICCVEYSSLSCALMLNFTLFEDDARQAAICISDSQIKFGGLAEFKQNYFCSRGLGLVFVIERVKKTLKRSESLTFSSGDLKVLLLSHCSRNKEHPWKRLTFCMADMKQRRNQTRSIMDIKDQFMASWPHRWSFYVIFSFFFNRGSDYF